MQINFTDITIDPDRQRKRFDDDRIQELSESLRLVGQIHNIVLDENNVLLAGECRIRAAKLLGWKSLEATYRKDLEEWQKEVLQLEENIRRQVLSYEDELAAKVKIHNTYQKQHGKAKMGVAGGWTIADTAQLLNISVGRTSQDLKLAEAIKKNPELGKLKTKSAAMSAFRRQQAANLRTIIAIVKKKETPIQADAPKLAFPTYTTPDKQTILINAEAEKAISIFPNNHFACLITDPPWNVQYDERFGSNPDTGLIITQKVLALLYPKLQEGAICWMFCATKHLIKGTIYNIIQTCGYRTFDQVLVWHKKHVAHSSNPYRELKNDYEPAFVFSKGEARDFTEPMYAVQEYKVAGTKVHDAQKPFDLLQLLITQSTVKGEVIIDPFMGSGQTLKAARLEERRSVGIEKMKEIYDTAVTEVCDV